MKTKELFRKQFSVALLSAIGALFVPAAAGLAPSALAATSVAGLPDFTDLAEKAGPAVVNIRTTERVRSNASGAMTQDEEMQEFFRRFFGAPLPQQPAPRRRQQPNAAPEVEEQVPRGVGSGFIISADGFVMTNAHVIDGADEVYVTLTDKREYKAKIVGADKRTDVAIVKIEGSNLPRLTMGDSDKIRVGEWVVAIGSPFGLDSTVTAGIVSAKARDTGDYLPLIQTDVAVNPGNSGGPLLNMRGEVIGINSQIYSRSGGFMGISFAVPIDEAMRVADQLRTTGKVTRGRIGVQIGEVTKDVAESLGLARAQGALVQRVEPDGPAEKAGLEAGDVILKFNGTQIERSSDLPRIVGATKPGSRSTVTVWRKGAQRDLSVNIVELESDQTAAPQQQNPKAPRSANMLGLVVADLTPTQLRALNIDGGALVEMSEGAAARAGLRAGDIVLRVNNTDVKDSRQFNELVAKLDAKKTTLLLVRRGDSSQFVTVKPLP
ncbi:peptidase [Oxalicibacterium flavum]|uniref:Probable periplasmic serine endoprotease DegP-like n=1 Tax=Oxalicibacterium flavum TaxID=179467 RepID=A0A8J2UMH0_9BURK|nr:DegQ family serine endoprotease [Oxalicibacterium flavum]GGC18188.1 peptidase [Oxalicibacterium flavum]